jgi:hypothetical protein
MKTMHRSAMAACVLIACLGAGRGDAATITWIGSANNLWSDPSKWEADSGEPTNRVPVNGDDVIVAVDRSYLNIDFTIESGRALTHSNGRLEFHPDGSLTLAEGGTMTTDNTRFRLAANAFVFTIEPNAVLTNSGYHASTISNDDITGGLIWIADANGVTTWHVGGDFTSTGNLTVDLSSYDITNGTTLVLVDYDDGATVNGEFASTELTVGWSGSVDYAYDNDPTAATNLTIALTDLSQHAVKTWDDGAGDDNWSSATNWVDDVAPTNGDSVVLTATTQSFLDYDWTIESGRSLTSTTNGSADDMGISPGASLTLATGGTMDIGLLRPRSGGTRSFIIEAGASLDMDVYGSGFQMDITFEADAMGVTTWNHSGGIGFLADTLTVDLSAYDIASGSELILVDYDGAFDGNAFSATNLTHGWTADLDYAYDQGGGDLAIALTNIVALPKGMVFTIR